MSDDSPAEDKTSSRAGPAARAAHETLTTLHRIDVQQLQILEMLAEMRERER